MNNVSESRVAYKVERYKNCLNKMGNFPQRLNMIHER